MEAVNFAGNDYLGLARDPRVAGAAAEAAREHGVSATSGRFFLGWSGLHRQIERDLASFFGAEDACLLTSTYLGGLVFFGAMAAHHDTVFCDEHSHPNLVKGMRAAGLTIHTYRHLDAGDLGAQLQAYAGTPPVIATDGVFGISGEMAPVADLAELARSHEAELLIDDAHGVFALGANGRGACETAGLGPDEVLVLGSMSKALGCAGGFFVGRGSVMRELQPATAGASPLALPIVGACIEALRILRTDTGIRERMWHNAARMRGVLDENGIAVVSRETPILAMVLRDEAEARRLAEHLEAHGLRVPYAKYPSEPRENLLRSAARACYTDDDLDRFRDALASFRATPV